MLLLLGVVERSGLFDNISVVSLRLYAKDTAIGANEVHFHFHFHIHFRFLL
jgi:hypothetical protein